MSGYVPVKKGTDASPQIGLPQQAERRGGTDPSSPESQDVIDRHAATINSWVGAQRQNVANSIIPIHSRTLDHPEYTVSYQNIHGTESVTVSPKPVPPADNALETESPAAEKKQEDEDELPPPLTAEQPEVTEANPLCLMVLYYGKDTKGQSVASVGAVPMKDLASATVQYQGAAQKSDWVSKPGTDRLMVMQHKFGANEFVLLPLDITGKTTASNLFIMTPVLGDAFATQASAYYVPVMNGSAELVYTVGGAISYIDSKFEVQAGLYVEPTQYGTPTPLVPHAIDTDGTGYFFPQLNSSTPMLLNPACTPVAQSSVGLEQQASDQVTAVDDKLQTVQAAYATTIFFTTSLEDFYNNGSKASHDNFTVEGKTAQIRTGIAHKAGISGTSYYGSAGFGQGVTLQNFMHAEGSQDYSSYIGGGGKNVDAYAIVTASGTTSTLDNVFPLMDYESGRLVIDPVKYQAVELSHTVVKFDTTKPKTVQTGAFEVVAGTGVRFDTSANPTAYKEYTWEVDGFDPSGHPPPTPDNGNQYNAGTIEAYYETIKNDFASQPGFLGMAEVDMVELTLTSGVTNAVAYGSTSGEFSSSDETDTDPWPEDDILAVAVGYSSGSGSAYSASASSKHFPYSYPTLTSTVANASLSIFGDSLTFNEDTSTSAPTQEAGILVSSFPPMYQGKPYYLRLTGTQDVPQYDVFSPFEHHSGVQGLGSLTPWLHVDNGTECIQGYVVDGTPFLFRNGGAGGNYLTTLASALGCKPEDVVAVVMDVSLEKIKQVANVKPPNYSSGSGGVPTGPVSTD